MAGARPVPPHRRRRTPGRVPLVRALSKLGFASRAQAHALIVAGRVRVDDVVVDDPTRLVVPEQIAVTIDEVEQQRGPRRVIAFHKPRGVVTTRRDPEGRRTVFDILGEHGRGLVVVGRLDMASTGLLLLTNDTRLAASLTDPARRVPRNYVVTVRGRVTPESAARLRQGLVVPAPSGGTERLSAETIELRKTSSRETHLMVTLVEGKNREIRRLFSAIGHEVTRLHRIGFGGVSLGTLQPGEHRVISQSSDALRS